MSYRIVKGDFVDGFESNNCTSKKIDKRNNIALHNTLEERIAEEGGKFEAAPQIEWKEPAGNEVW